MPGCCRGRNLLDIHVHTPMIPICPRPACSTACTSLVSEPPGCCRGRHPLDIHVNRNGPYATVQRVPQVVQHRSVLALEPPFFLASCLQDLLPPRERDREMRSRLPLSLPPPTPLHPPAPRQSPLGPCTRLYDMTTRSSAWRRVLRKKVELFGETVSDGWSPSTDELPNIVRAPHTDAFYNRGSTF